MTKLQDDMYFHSFIENSIDGAWRLDLEEPISITLSVSQQIDLLYKYGFFGEANMALAEQYGFNNPEEIIGFRLTEFLPREFPDSIITLKQLINANYQIKGIETVERNRTGQTKYFLNNIVGEFREDKLIHIWGTAKDITHQKHLESEVYLRSKVFEQIPDGCVIVEANTENIIYLNPAFTTKNIHLRCETK